jgi:hypothetical protein
VTAPKTTMSSAPVLTGPRLEPVPVDGCDVCAALADQRAEWRKVGDFSKVSDCNVEMAQHPHKGRG